MPARLHPDRRPQRRSRLTGLGLRPVIVGTPPSDAFIGLSRMPDGELRHYNYGSHPASAQPLYLSSRDSG